LSIALVLLLILGGGVMLLLGGCSGPPYKWIVDSSPTVLFTREAGRLYQLVDAKIAYWLPDPATFQGRVDVEDLGTHQVIATDVGQVSYGEKTYRVRVPDIAAPTRLAFRLYDAGAPAPGEFQNEIVKDWAPQRKWTVSLLPSSHIDLYSTANADITPEQHRKILDTVMDVCDRYPEYKYQIENRIPIYEYLDGHRSPEQIDHLIGLIRQGRIGFGAELTGIHQFTASGESYVQGQMVPWNEGLDLEKLYGIKPAYCSVFDTPGMMKQIPEFLNQDGVKYLFFASNTTYHIWEMLGIPFLFYWKSESGARVLTWRSSCGYKGEKEDYFKLTSPDPAEQERSVTEKLVQRQESRDEKGNVNPNLAYPFDHTAIIWNYGDNEPADAGPVTFMRSWNSRFAYPRFKISSNAEFMGEMESLYGPRIPERQGEIANSWEFVVMNQGIINLYDRYSQRSLPDAQKLWSVSGLLGNVEYPGTKVQEAWDNMAKTEAHDLFYGATIDPNTGELIPDFMNPDWAKAEWSLIAERDAREAYDAGLSSLASRVNTGGVEKIAVFNTLSQARAGPVALKAPESLNDDRFVIRDDATGDEIPHQLLDASVYQDCFGRRPSMKNQDSHFNGAYQDPPASAGKYIVFIAGRMPPLGYKTFSIVPRAEPPNYTGGPVVSAGSLENESYRVTLDAGGGGVSSIVDKELGKELVDPAAQVAGKKVLFNQFLKGIHSLDCIPMLVNLGLLYPARDFWQPVLDGIARNGLKTWDADFAGTVEVAASGPVVSALVVTGKDAWGVNRRQTVVLYRGVKRVDFVNWVENAGFLPFERYVMSYPLALTGDFSVRYDNPYSVARVGSDELPGGPAPERHLGDWVEFKASDCGVSIASPDVGPFTLGKPDVNLVDDARYLVPEKPYYFPVWLDTCTWSAFVIPGSYTMRFSLASSGAGADDGWSHRFGTSISHPLAGTVVKSAAGPLAGAEASFFSVDKPNVDITVVKKPARGNGLTLRLVETEGRNGGVTLNLGGASRCRRAYRAKLNEEPVAALKCSGSRVFLSLKPYEVATVRLDI
jgi:hypothetical protein